MEEQQRERREREAAALRRKEKHDCSANASPEVKQRLQVRGVFWIGLFAIVLIEFFMEFQSFIIQKKQNAAINGQSSASYRL